MLLHNRRILIVEDEYMLATDLSRDLQNAGATVIGPEPSVARALSRVAAEHDIDGAVLDVNLAAEPVFPVADALAARDIPFLFTSGYGAEAVADRYPGAIHCSKPLNIPNLIQALQRLFS